ncbi:serine hydrolase domain-containing protein [Phenylobacterium parvum]|uniref:Serine hydrolase n=1 Tax=Phenylobacterium parvum TaxID=2201350 RepID=A0A2Z3HU52_9CAUL|nr:serine hydrolase [Phenylobacterium parvum]AWM76860.1 serine hydrolase [Phenylobacterium parvum]
MRALILAAALAASALPALAADKPPPAASVLFWSQAQKEAGFPKMEAHFPVSTAARGERVHALLPGAPLSVNAVGGQPFDLAAYMTSEKTAGILVLQDGKVRLERYGLGYGPNGRWTSFSVAKSVTSTLVGAAVKDGYIKSLDDKVTRYIPGLRGSAYDQVSVRQLLTMTSGVKWNEDYTDPNSDVALLFSTPADPGLDSTVSYMRKLPREAAPGAKWVYKTGETNLIGVLVTSATGKSLSAYLSEKIWKPYGMEQDALWMIDERSQEAGGCCLSMTLRDYGRVGEFLRTGGAGAAGPVLPAGWIADATREHAATGDRFGYGYQWWTEPVGVFNGLGIFGQRLHVDPARKLVVVVSSAWPEATNSDRSARQDALIAAIAAQLDAEAKP